MDRHKGYMKRALELAEKGWGKTNPNPLVGAVVVKDGVVVAEGFHKLLGCAHAEVEAFKNATEDVRGATLYVNLEPCSHYGRTPPCAKAIVDAGIKEVVIGMVDPNPKVSGRGIKILEDAGIKVISGVLEEECKKLNEIFITYITKKKPFVIMKTAMTLDGKIASTLGDSKWISGEKSRQIVHQIRNRVAAIMVGINTVIQDNPQLTTRLEAGDGRDAVRVIVDSKGRIPEESHVVTMQSDAGTILATTSMLPSEKEERLVAQGIRIIKAEGSDGRVDLKRLMEELYKLEIDSVLLEGGGGLNFSALSEGVVDKVMLFIAPKIIGGAQAVTPVEGKGIGLVQDAMKVENMKVCRYEDDILVEGYIT